jgi:hypothetical protein
MQPLSVSTAAGVPCRARALEDLPDIDRGGHRQRDRAKAQAAVVVQEVHDLRAPAAGQRPVGHVRLPALIRQLRREAHERGARPLARLGGDQTAPPQQPPDRAHRGHRAVATRQVPVDRQRAGIKALREKVLAQRDDLSLKRRGHRTG